MDRGVEGGGVVVREGMQATNRRARLGPAKVRGIGKYFQWHREESYNLGRIRTLGTVAEKALHRCRSR
jgi:hypothetical protein